MPTPSNNAPDPPRSPRFSSFSTCPDEMHGQEEPGHQASTSSPTETQHDNNQESQPQSRWHSPSPSSPSTYNMYTSQINDEHHTPRSATLSPASSIAPTAPSAEPSVTIRRGIGTRLDRDGVRLSEYEDHDNKDADVVDPMLGISSNNQGSSVGGESSENEAQRVDRQHMARAQMISSLTETEGPRSRGGLTNFSSRNWRRPDLVGQPSTPDETHMLERNMRRHPPDRATILPQEAQQPTTYPPSDTDSDSTLYAMSYDTHPRVIPISPCPYLRAGSRFHGTQQSERQRYEVQVEIKHVDLRESFLCGYLRIQGLTEDHPTLTTYFEGEIIGSKYGFATQHPDWGASDKTDMSHWGKFQAFRPIQKLMKKAAAAGQSLRGTNGLMIHDVGNCENIFMRWKEHFLVPDHRVRTIHGASFEGFYYICFNQLRGEVSGIYFHSKSEKFQQLELKHVEDKGCYGAVEFR